MKIPRSRHLGSSFVAHCRQCGSVWCVVCGVQRQVLELDANMRMEVGELRGDLAGGIQVCW